VRDAPSPGIYAFFKVFAAIYGAKKTSRTAESGRIHPANENGRIP
jgi:hypothetical protein